MKSIILAAAALSMALGIVACDAPNRVTLPSTAGPGKLPPPPSDDPCSSRGTLRPSEPCP